MDYLLLAGVVLIVVPLFAPQIISLVTAIDLWACAMITRDGDKVEPTREYGGSVLVWVCLFVVMAIFGGLVVCLRLYNIHPNWGLVALASLLLYQPVFISRLRAISE